MIDSDLIESCVFMVIGQLMTAGMIKDSAISISMSCLPRIIYKESQSLKGLKTNKNEIDTRKVQYVLQQH